MPIYEYKCKTCAKLYSILTKVVKPYSSRCPECDGEGEKLVSVPGYRRDHTIVDS